MEGILVKKVNVEELEVSQKVLLCINNLKPEEFVALFVRGELLINERVSDETTRRIEMFVNRNDLFTDNAAEMFLDQIFKEYGFEAYVNIVEASRHIYKKRRMREAKHEAEALFRVIKEWIVDVEDDPFDEFLVFHLSKLIYEECPRHKTAFNMVGADQRYIFYYGYLMGKGLIMEGKEDEN